MPRPKKPAPAAAIWVQHSLSDAQAATLRLLIGEHVQAQVALSWAGGGDPLDTPVLESQAALAEAQVSAFIARLVRDGK